MSSPLSNGTGPSPPPTQTVASTKGYPLSFVIQGNSGTKSSGAGNNIAAPSTTPVSVAGFAKGQSLVFNNMGVAQLQSQTHVIGNQQVTAPLQQQRGTAFVCSIVRVRVSKITNVSFA